MPVQLLMKTRSPVHVLSALMLLAAAAVTEARVIRYEFPPEWPVSDTYQVKADGAALPAMRTKRGAILSFGMRGPVGLEVKLPKPPKEIVVRPLSAGIVAERDGAGFRLRLPKPMNLSVEVDGDLRNPLLVFANPDLPEPDRNDPKVKYFEAGRIHEAGEILLKDGESLYLAGGAVVRGVVRALGARHVSVRGPGILDGGSRKRKINMLVLRECRDASLENFILLDPFGWSIHLSGSQQVRLYNTRVVGWRANSDGLDIEYSKNVKADGCFWRTNDDCIAVKAIYPPGTKDVPFEEMINPETLGGHKVPRIEGDTMGDISIDRCVLWNDSGGQGFEIGFELRIDEVRGIAFRDSDIIHVHGGAFTIHNGDRARIEDLLVEDVRVEEADRLLDFHVGLSIYSDDCPPPYRRSNPDRKAVPADHRPAHANNPYQWYVPEEAGLARFEAGRGSIHDVLFRNVRVATKPRLDSMLNGYSERHGISEIAFEGLVIDGKTILSAGEANIHAVHVRDLRFRPRADR